ncbi:hypothetical protein FKM82_019357 [Ascaphus truei]
MSGLIVSVGFLIAVIECAAGIILNFYIMTVNFFDWKRGHRLSPCDQILVNMALNNVFLQCGLNVEALLSVWFPGLMMYRNVYIITSLLLMFLIYFSFWLTAWLCIYYCLRIVSLKHHLFILLKFRIAAVMPKLLLVSAVGSFAISIPCIWEVHVGTLLGMGNVTASHFVNTTSFNFSFHYKSITIALGCCLPFLLALFSIALTLTSLWTHSRRMKKNASGFSPHHMDAHFRAGGIMVLLSILYAAFYITGVTVLASPVIVPGIWEIISFFFILIYPTAQSSIVIMGNTKLRTTCLRTLHCTGRI